MVTFALPVRSELVATTGRSLMPSRTAVKGLPPSPFVPSVCPAIASLPNPKRTSGSKAIPRSKSRRMAIPPLRAASDDQRITLPREVTVGQGRVGWSGQGRLVDHAEGEHHLGVDARVE